MMPRFLLFLALFACVVALVVSTAAEADKDVKFSEFDEPKNREKRQMGWRLMGYNQFGSYGSFYRYNPWTGTTSTGYFNPLGGARAVSGFGPYGVPFAFNNAYLYG